jgi:YHS domain-containing protein
MIIVRLFAAIIIFYFLFRFAKWLFLSSGKASEPLPNRQAPLKMEDLVEDPCCHTYLPVSQAYQTLIDGKTEYFCSEKCCNRFLQKEKSP